MAIDNYGKAASSGAAFVIFTFLAGVVLFGLTGCGDRAVQDATPSNQVREMRFRIDEDLVGPSVAIPELGISLRPPMGWEPRTVPVQGDLPVDVLRLFVGDGPSYLLVGILDSDESPQTVAESLVAGENDELTDFIHNGIHFYQIRRVTAENISFSIVFDVTASDSTESGILQFVIPTTDAEDRARTVESSFGSVESL